MVWQDTVIALANILFGYSLTYQVYVGFKRKRGYLTLQTACLTTIGIYTLAICFFTLHLYLSTIVEIVTGTLWLALTIQRIVYKKA
ncbi:MAG TPA: hypothetical protein VL945_01370 [Candidatus Saccharimonadales bacterium]|nr:hypothetical protein [Candidatus Saccharimonadales bacterium]